MEQELRTDGEGFEKGISEATGGAKGKLVPEQKLYQYQFYLEISEYYQHYKNSPVLISPICGYHNSEHQLDLPEQITKSKTVLTCEYPLLMSLFQVLQHQD